MINIGFMLFDGRGVNRNIKEAVDYMKAPANSSKFAIKPRNSVTKEQAE